MHGSRVFPSGVRPIATPFVWCERLGCRGRVRRLSARIGAALALACGLLGAIGQLGRWSDGADAINLASPYLLAAGSAAAAAAAGLAPRRSGWRVRLVGLASICLLILGPLPLVLADRPLPAPMSACHGRSIRLAQFNVWKENHSTPSVARWIQASGVDVVTLQEALTRPSLPALLPGFPFRQSCVGRAGCSTMIASRLPFRASGGLAAGDPENRGALSAAWARIDIGGRPITLVSTHLGRPPPWRRYEPDRALLAAFVRRQDSMTTIVAGDLNLPGWTYQMQRLEAALRLRRVTRMLPTWPAATSPTGALFGLDHVLVGSSWQVVSVDRGPALGSDHYPLLVKLRLCAGRPG